MTLKTILFGAATALMLSAGAANAVPATAETSLNVRSGPGTQYEVVGTIRAGETVDAGNCIGSWCGVSFAGGSGFANRSYLAMGGGGPAVAVAPSYAYSEPYYDDYYDYGYAYGPSVGFYASPGYRHGWRGRWDRRHAWTGGGRHWQGGGNWTRPDGPNPSAAPGTVTPRQGFAGPSARPGAGIGAGAHVSGGGMAGASAGMRVGGRAIGAGGGMRAGGGAIGGGGAAAAPRAQGR